MTPQQEIEAALERLSETAVRVLVTADDYHSFMEASISKPLAALIRKAAEPIREGHRGVLDLRCKACGRFHIHGEPEKHAPDCALLALCRAINGGTKL